MRVGWKHLLVLAVVAPLLGLAVGWSGLISVRASTGHWAVTDWFLHWVMRNSVETRSMTTKVPPLDDEALLAPAAGHFQTGCALCHGSPAQGANDSVLSALPPPPNLKMRIPEWTDAQLFEIVKHGVRFTGMPAWPTQARDDEVWAMVAFLRRLPEMGADEYRHLAGLQTQTGGPVSPASVTCDSCHAENRLDDTSLIPRLAGQSEAYLFNSLRAYAMRERASGIMQVAAGTLDEEALRSLASTYAGQVPQPRQSVARDPELVEKGRALAEHGRSKDEVPACLNCHERPVGNPAYPRLSGQTSVYLRQQLHLFKDGTRGGSQYQHLMTQAAKGLTPDDIEALSAYFSDRETTAR
jgi:cytochrome c553